jgi:hypothetical protein
MAGKSFLDQRGPGKIEADVDGAHAAPALQAPMRLNYRGQ